MSKPVLEVLDVVTRRAKPIRISGVLLYTKTGNKIEIKIEATFTKYGFISFP
jgi:hypothetical protein